MGRNVEGARRKEERVRGKGREAVAFLIPEKE
jgi:hypothetical protein